MRPAFPVFAALVLAGNTASADVTRSLKAELSADATHPFRVENLAGHMVVRQGTGPRVVVTATVHGEDSRTAALLRLEEVRDSKTGQPTLRVQYPLNDYTSYRYAGEKDGNSDNSFFSGLFSGLRRSACCTVILQAASRSASDGNSLWFRSKDCGLRKHSAT